MAGFKDFLNNNGGLLSSIIGLVPALFSKSYRNKLTGAHLTGAEKEANAFSAQQAQNQTVFQQQMRDTQYQSAVQDMQKAGLNPALMYGSGASGNVAPSGAMASSVTPTSGQDPMGLISMIANLSLLNAQRRNIDADTKNKLEQANKAKEEAILTRLKQNFQEQVNEWYPDLSQNTLDIGAAQIAQAYSVRDVNVESLDDIAASAALKDSQRAINEVEKEWIPRLREAQEKGQLASAAAGYASAAYDRYVTNFASSHNGQMPGFNSAFGMYTAVTGELQKLFGSEGDLPTIIGETIAKAIKAYKDSQNDTKGKKGHNVSGAR